MGFQLVPKSVTLNDQYGVSGAVNKECWHEGRQNVLRVDKGVFSVCGHPQHNIMSRLQKLAGFH